MTSVFYLSNKKKFIVLVTFLLAFCSHAQTTISSVSALAEAASRSGQNIVMTPGVYEMQDYLTPNVISNTPTDGRGASSMITFSGNNNTFDLTGVTIQVNTALLNDFRTRVIEFYVTGDNVTVKGLTVTDIGTSPTHNGGQSFVVDGANNSIENVTLNVNGSSEYGYGDLLGKGDGNLVTMRKHSGMLIEGLNIDIIGCSIYSRAIGHLFFIQGGRNVLFRDCYAEAVTRTTDDMLAETSGPAFDLDFAAVYRNLNGDKVITPGYTKSLSEVGYRSYGSGGVEGNATGAITLINCKAKDTRSGFAFTRYGGDVLMQNCEAIGCEAGFQVQEVTIENSRGDAVNGPLIYLNGGASDVELELIPNLNRTTLHAIATIGGNNHNVTLSSSGSIRTQEHSILVGSTRPSGANPFSPMGTTATSNLTLNNCTGMPIVIGSTASSNTITTNGSITDNGSGNSIVRSNDCDETPTTSFTPDPNKTYYIDSAIHNVRIAATGESNDAYTTNKSETGSDVEWKFVDKGNGYWHIERAAGGTRPRLRRDNSPDADMQETTSSGTWTYYEITAGDIANSYFLTLPDAPVAYNRLQVNRELDVKMVPSAQHDGTWESFFITEAETTTRVSNIRLEAEDFDNMSGIQTEVSSESGDNVGYINNGDWLRFDDVNLSGISNLDIRVASNFTGGTVEVRTGSTSGTLIGAINVSNTGGNQNWTTLNTSISNASGTQDVYLVFTGGNGYLFNINWIEFNTNSRSNKEIEETLNTVSNVIIYPNPVVSTTTIENAANLTITIYAMDSSTVFSKAISNESEVIDLSGVATGIYFAEIKGEGILEVIKLVKE